METNPFRAYAGGRDGDAADGPRPRPSGASGRGTAEGATGPPLRALPGRISAWVAERVAGRSWRVRAALLPILAWMLHGYLTDPAYSSIFAGVNLGFHEAGHAAFMWFGSRILTVAGGTIFQLTIPVVAAVYLLRKQGDPFGAAVCLFWLGTALADAGVYAADARAQALPLVSPFGPVDVDSHDWTFMLMKYGMLSRDQEIGGLLRGAGLLSMATSLATGAWVLRVMASTRGSGGPAYADASENRRFASFLRNASQAAEARTTDGSPASPDGRAGSWAGPHPSSEDPPGPEGDPHPSSEDPPGPEADPNASLDGRPDGSGHPGASTETARGPWPQDAPRDRQPARPLPRRAPRYRSYLDPDGT